MLYFFEESFHNLGGRISARPHLSDDSLSLYDSTPLSVGMSSVIVSLYALSS